MRREIRINNPFSFLQMKKKQRMIACINLPTVFITARDKKMGFLLIDPLGSPSMQVKLATG
jgi:hypothetical protein